MPRDLPPPPPPVHLREWMDETVVRADRARFLRDLAQRTVGLGQLLLLWAVSAVFALGWSFVGMALMAFEEGGVTAAVLGVVFAVLGVGVLVPAGFWFAWGARRERQVRQLLRAWAESGRDPDTDPRMCQPWRSLTWLLASLVLGALGLWLTFGVAVQARPGEETYGEVAYYMGLGMILWITGLLGLGKAGAHYRWAVRAFRRPTARPPASRSASTAPPPPGSGTRSRSSAPVA
ncbi:hypothetical protein [Streptomyces sp. ISL-86]|uniref:hypothetical protein n=1 Tax=Streptomyces sp. ISL-86 TaxID=2819187 RepID=UPI001BE93F57|nr:hypothetical protein [Streptomyces sp. ISL-86]MBT2455070.1 hypothetical protein [Streptomyces sp. ISL-86]